MKEGDKVVATRSSEWFDKGEKGVVVHVEGRVMLVQWEDGGGQWWALVDELEVVP